MNIFSKITAVKVVADRSSVNLPGIIRSLEELVLADAGVDAFEEILKLICVKLYDEKNGKHFFQESAGVKKTRFLFDAAKQEWPGIFKKTDRIELSPAHLTLSVKLLEKIHLRNTDLAIIDNAFEYLLPKAAKGSRGQFFTPRHVITEMITILSPKKNERILDPTCGSGGFLLHAFMQGGRNNKQIFGIDFDSRMVKIARAMLLLAGAEHVRIVKANSLNPIKEFPEESFDVLYTNPPFGGDVRDTDLLSRYSLAKNSRGEIRSFAPRHILFLERIVRLLKPGGRAGIVVPQGVLNNTNLSYVREWLFGQARIIGVIGLDINTFKPHTNVKTSLLFLQKWKNKPPVDYPVFMAVSRKSGKNLSGEILYKTENGAHVIDSDLQEIAGRLREFTEKEKLGF
jgi:type I restriction enzyme M protein